MNSNYKPEYCEEIIRFGKEGKYLHEFAKSLNLSKSAIESWSKKYPEFKEAIKLAFNYRKSYYEKAKKERFNAKRREKRSLQLLNDKQMNSEQNALPVVLEPQESLPERIYFSGRNKKYKPEYCEDIIRHGIEGGNFCEFCTKLRINLNTLFHWADMHPKFKEAMDLSKTMAEGFMWGLARKELNIKFNFRLWQFIMENEYGYKGVNSNKVDETQEEEVEEVRNVVILPEIKHREEIKEIRLAAGTNNESEVKNSNAETNMDTAGYTE